MIRRLLNRLLDAIADRVVAKLGREASDAVPSRPNDSPPPITYNGTDEHGVHRFVQVFSTPAETGTYTAVRCDGGAWTRSEGAA
jgi:hypothetical protein